MLGPFTNFVLFAFANEGMSGKSVWIISTATYDKYFGQEIFDI